MSIWPSTLLPSALFSFVVYLANFFLMAPLGAWIDRNNRMYIMSTAIIGQGVGIIVNVVLLWGVLLIVPPDGQLVWTSELIMCFSALLVSATIAELMGSAATISIERDWLVEIVGKIACVFICVRVCVPVCACVCVCV
jgi:iron-regulated transporter 1